MSPAAELAAAVRAGVYERVGKRALDFAVGLIALVIAAPIMGGAAIAIRVSMGRPVILRQRRVGRDGDVFAVYKFRTMMPDRRIADHPFVGSDRRKVHKSANDPRITPVGRWLRRTSIDELPQLINVLRGEMSLVGPRPELVEIVAGYEGWQHARHLVKPGLTGVWQLEARDDAALMHQRTDLDIQYVESVSLGTDMRLLLRTIPNVLTRGFGHEQKERAESEEQRWEP